MQRGKGPVKKTATRRSLLRDSLTVWREVGWRAYCSRRARVIVRGVLRAVALLMALSQQGRAQAPTADPADVGTIADIVRASYEVISGGGQIR